MKRSERPISSGKRKPLFDFEDDEPAPIPVPRQKPISITIPTPPNEKILPLAVVTIIIVNGMMWFIMLLAYTSTNRLNVGYAFGFLLCIPMVIVLMLIQWIIVYLHYKFFWWVWMVYGLIFTLFTLMIIGIALSGQPLPVPQ